MKAEYIQDCSSNSDLLEYYAEREDHLRSGGNEIKKAIADLEMSGWFAFNMKNLNDKRSFQVQRMMYQNSLYAIVTNSCINYIFKIYL